MLCMCTNEKWIFMKTNRSPCFKVNIDLKKNFFICNTFSRNNLYIYIIGEGKIPCVAVYTP